MQAYNVYTYIYNIIILVQNNSHIVTQRLCMHKRICTATSYSYIYIYKDTYFLFLNNFFLWQN